MCQEKNNEQVMEFVSKERQSIFLATRQSDLETAISLAATHLRDDPSARKDVMNMWLRRKGAILEAQKGFQDALIYSDDPGVGHLSKTRSNKGSTFATGFRRGRRRGPGGVSEKDIGVD